MVRTSPPGCGPMSCDTIRGIRSITISALRVAGIVMAVTLPHVLWTALGVMGVRAFEDEAAAYQRRLQEFPPEIRRDIARMLQVAVREIPRRWSRTGGVPRTWIVIDDDGRLTAARHRGAVTDNPYADGIHSSGMVAQTARERLGANRCAAMLYGNAWRAFRLPFGTRRDTSAQFTVVHRDVRFAVELGLSFTRPGLLRRPRMAPGLAQVFAEAARE